MDEETEQITDSELLDYLGKLAIPADHGWQLRASSTGRGWRLCTTTRQPNCPSPREAIDAAIRVRNCCRELGKSVLIKLRARSILDMAIDDDETFDLDRRLRRAVSTKGKS